ncbi:hypothetical protein C0J45_24080, partial [Silurus meridionalis]
TSSASVIKRSGESDTLSCTVSVPGKGHIDSGTGTTFSQSLQGQFSISKHTNRNMLYAEVKSLKAEDTAVW